MAGQDVRRMALPESLGPAEAAELADQFRALRGAPLDIEAHGVKRLSALCVQVLLSAAASWRADGVALGFLEPSPECEESLRVLGLTPEALSAGAAA
jgi:chemotaxis protein CheX